MHTKWHTEKHDKHVAVVVLRSTTVVVLHIMDGHCASNERKACYNTLGILPKRDGNKALMCRLTTQSEGVTAPTTNEAALMAGLARYVSNRADYTCLG